MNWKVKGKTTVVRTSVCVVYVDIYNLQTFNSLIMDNFYGGILYFLYNSFVINNK